MSDPPWSAGGVQPTVTEPTPASAVTLVGGPGAPEGDGDGDGVAEGEAVGVEDGLGVAVGVGDGDGGGGPITRGTRFRTMPLPEPPLIAYPVCPSGLIATPRLGTVLFVPPKSAFAS